MSYDATYRFRQLFRGVPKSVDGFGEQALFYGRSLRYIPNALTRCTGAASRSRWVPC